MQKQNPYVPLSDYKSHLATTGPEFRPFDPRIADKLFKIEIDDCCVPYLLESPERGAFSTTYVPYGFFIYGYTGEMCIFVLRSPGQGGKTNISVTCAEVDGGMRTLAANVKWEEEAIAISDLVNRLYFGIE